MFEAIPIGEFESRIGIRTSSASEWSAATHIVSLRELVEVKAVEPMRRDYLTALIRNVRLAGGVNALVYDMSSVETMRIDPHGLLLGQTFVERGKYQRFLETFESLFASFCVPRGMAKLSACIAVGKTEQGAHAIAHYVPPIVERTQRGLALLDGVHRMFLARQVGTTIESVVVSPVGTPFPVDLHGWDRVSVVGEKPALAERYSNLRPELFRDLKHVGVDG